MLSSGTNPVPPAAPGKPRAEIAKAGEVAPPVSFQHRRTRTASGDRDPYAVGPRLRDRAQAGRELAKRLAYYANSDAVVVAVDNGAVPLAREIAGVLNLQLRCLAFSVVASPRYHQELALGAISEPCGTVVRNEELLHSLNVDDDEFRRLCEGQRASLSARVSAWPGVIRDAGDISGKPAIVVMDVDLVNKVALVRLVIRLLLAKCDGSAAPKSLVIASPAISPDTAKMVKPNAGHAKGLIFEGHLEWICIEGGERSAPESLDHCYAEWSPVSDAEVAHILKEHTARD